LPDKNLSLDELMSIVNISDNEDQIREAVSAFFDFCKDSHIKMEHGIGDNGKITMMSEPFKHYLATPEHVQIAKATGVEVQEGDVIVEGYMCTETLTRRGERCRNYLFNDSIATYMTNPQMLWNHIMMFPVGRVMEIRQDDQGTWVRCAIKDEAMKTRVSKGLVNAYSWCGYVKEHSVQRPDGSTATRDDEDYYNKANTWWINKADLIEVSCVAIGNVPDALFTIAKCEESDNLAFNMWCPFVSNGTDDDERMVYGYATVFGQTDSDGQRMTRQAMEEALPQYADWRNIREMHNKGRAVGTAPLLEIDDYGVRVGVRVSEGAQDAWIKCKDETYKGFSIGGWLNPNTDLVDTVDADGNSVKDIIHVNMDEISICDRPKVGNAKFTLVKCENGAMIDYQDIGGDSDKMSIAEKIGSKIDELKDLLAGMGSEKPEEEVIKEVIEEEVKIEEEEEPKEEEAPTPEVEPEPEEDKGDSINLPELMETVDKLEETIDFLVQSLTSIAVSIKDTQESVTNLTASVKETVDRIEVVENSTQPRMSVPAGGAVDNKTVSIFADILPDCDPKK